VQEKTNILIKMKKSILFVSCCFCLSLTLSVNSIAQISVVSTKGYIVDINVQPVAIVPSSSTNCRWGYNYNVQLSYTILFRGTNIPGSLYTLQGNVGCGTNANFFSLPRSQSNGTVTSQSNPWRSVSDCSTATVSSLNCNTVAIRINGPGISDRTISYPVVYTPLPVTLINFSATPVGNKIKIAWSTATETNNAFFTVERSSDGSDWVSVARIEGAGNSTVQLQYITYDDAAPAGTVYYRLKQTDLDGKFVYSTVVAVQAPGSKHSIGIYPIPNRSNTITITGISNYSNYRLSLCDASGQVLFSGVLSSPSLSLPTLNPGIYIISFDNRTTGEKTVQRYVKL
jgi:hypothetical protein